MFARFEVRRLDIGAARKLLGTAIGMCPKEKLFKGYIQLELDLREFERVRTLYQKYIEVSVSGKKYLAILSLTWPKLQWDASNSAGWIKFAELESQLGDYARTRAIYELGVTQSALSMPELLWKAYIDFEVEEGEREKARALYERLVGSSGHVKVWIAYAMFEKEAMAVPRAEREEEEEDDEEEEKETPMVPGDANRARAVFDRAYKDLKGKGLKSEVCFGPVLPPSRGRVQLWICAHCIYQRVALLEVWKTFEEEHGSDEDVKKVQGMMPIVSKRRHVDEETGQVVEGRTLVTPSLMSVRVLTSFIDWEMVFADDEREANPTSFKFLQMAHAWKAKQAAGGGGGGDAVSGMLAGFTKALAPAQQNQEDLDGDDDDDDASSVASSAGGQ
jgi:crooked neck